MYNITMRRETAALLRNPYTGERLRLEKDKLVSEESGHSFQIRKGIPNFLNEISLQGRNRRFRRFYDSVAFAYDAVMELGDRLKVNTEGLIRQEYVTKLEIQPGDKVLETAVGTATNILLLPKEGEYYGLDISWGMLKQAQRKLVSANREAEFFQGDGAYLPFQDNCFDAVLNMGGLQYYSDPYLGVREMVRVAKPGTTIHILDEVKGAVRTLKRNTKSHTFSHKKRFTIDDLPLLAPRNTDDIQWKMLPGGEYYSLAIYKHK